jgi:hypothetical protein
MVNAFSRKLQEAITRQLRFLSFRKEKQDGEG